MQQSKYKAGMIYFWLNTLCSRMGCPQSLLRPVALAIVDGALHFFPFWARHELEEISVCQPSQEKATEQHVHPEIWHVEKGDDENGVC